MKSAGWLAVGVIAAGSYFGGIFGGILTALLVCILAVLIFITDQIAKSKGGI